MEKYTYRTYRRWRDVSRGGQIMQRPPNRQAFRKVSGLSTGHAPLRVGLATSITDANKDERTARDQGTLSADVMCTCLVYSLGKSITSLEIK